MTTRTRIKICGMTRAQDVRSAVKLGVDAIGVILHADSPRTISLKQAKDIRREIPAFVSLVGVFVDAEIDLIEKYCQQLCLDYVQLHGDESPDYAASLSRPYIKALRVKNRDQVVQAAQEYTQASAILLDPYVPGQHGGTGKLLDSHCWPFAGVASPLMLAGGLDPTNIRQRIEDLSPFAVDMNSGLELSPGHKSIELMEQAVQQVRLADQELESRHHGDGEVEAARVPS